MENLIVIVFMVVAGGWVIRRMVGLFTGKVG